MPLAIVLALAASLGIHAAALFGPDIELFGGTADEPVALHAELHPPPAVPAPPTASKRPVAKLRQKARPKPLATTQVTEVSPVVPAELEMPEATHDREPAVEAADKAVAPVKPMLPATGVIRFAIRMGADGFQVGRAEHRWEFTEDGQYRLYGMTETSGLVALFKSVRFENESRGRLVAGGLQPEHYLTRKNGREGNENADFDWTNAQVLLARDGQVRTVAPGTQDILSLNYHLAYVPRPESGATVGVVTGKKYERYALDSLGEEDIDTPAGRFRALHLRAMTDSVTEIWLALDHHRLPVKIRFTDKKGDVFEQIATELGIP